MKVKIVSDEEAEESDAVVCALWETCQKHSSDNIKANCADCNCEIGYRPYAPVKPIKICIQCLIKRMSH
jgi:hypothetical protein